MPSNLKKCTFLLMKLCRQWGAILLSHIVRIVLQCSTDNMTYKARLSFLLPTAFIPSLLTTPTMKARMLPSSLPIHLHSGPPESPWNPCKALKGEPWIYIRWLEPKTRISNPLTVDQFSSLNIFLTWHASWPPYVTRSSSSCSPPVANNLIPISKYLISPIRCRPNSAHTVPKEF